MMSLSPPGCPSSVAQEGVEPSASLGLTESGLPVAYRASRPPRCQRSTGQSARRGSNPPVRLGRAVPGPLGHGHVRIRSVVRPGQRRRPGSRDTGLQEASPGWVGVTVAEGRPSPGAGPWPGPSPASRHHSSSRDRVSSCPLLRLTGRAPVLAAQRFRRVRWVDGTTRREVRRPGQLFPTVREWLPPNAEAARVSRRAAAKPPVTGQAWHCLRVSDSGGPRHLPGFSRLSSITTSACFGSNPFGRGLPTHSLPFHRPTTHATFSLSPSRS
jgi:hypothetical protein